MSNLTAHGSKAYVFWRNSKGIESYGLLLHTFFSIDMESRRDTAPAILDNISQFPRHSVLIKYISWRAHVLNVLIFISLFSPETVP